MSLAICLDRSCGSEVVDPPTTTCPVCGRPKLERVTPHQLLVGVLRAADEQITRAGCQRVVLVPIPLAVIEQMRKVLA